MIKETNEITNNTIEKDGKVEPLNKDEINAFLEKAKLPSKVEPKEGEQQGSVEVTDVSKGTSVEGGDLDDKKAAEEPEEEEPKEDIASESEVEEEAASQESEEEADSFDKESVEGGDLDDKEDSETPEKKGCTENVSSKDEVADNDDLIEALASDEPGNEGESGEDSANVYKETENKEDDDADDAIKKDNSEVNKNAEQEDKPEKYEDLTYDQIEELMQTPEGISQLKGYIYDFQERYEAEMRGMTQEEYRAYKKHREELKEENEIKQKLEKLEISHSAENEAGFVLEEVDKITAKVKKHVPSLFKNINKTKQADLIKSKEVDIARAYQHVDYELKSTSKLIDEMNSVNYADVNPGKYNDIQDKIESLKQYKEKLREVIETNFDSPTNKEEKDTEQNYKNPILDKKLGTDLDGIPNVLKKNIIYESESRLDKVNKSGEQNKEKIQSASKQGSKRKIEREIGSIIDKNGKDIADLKSDQIKIKNEIERTYDEWAKLTRLDTSEKKAEKLEELTEKYTKLKELDSKIESAIAKLDMQNWDISNLTGGEYRSYVKKIEKAEIDSVFDSAESCMKPLDSGDRNLVEAYSISKKLEKEIMPTLDAEFKETLSRIEFAKIWQEEYCEKNQCSHSKAMLADENYRNKQEFISALENEAAKLESDLQYTVDTITKLRAEQKMDGSEFVISMKENEDGTLSIERTWKTGKEYNPKIDSKYIGFDGNISLNVTELKQTVIIGISSNKLYGKNRSFLYRGLAHKGNLRVGREDGLHISNDFEGGLLNMDASLSETTNISGKRGGKASAEASAIRAYDTLSYGFKEKEIKLVETKVTIAGGKFKAEINDEKFSMNMSASRLSAEATVGIGDYKIASIGTKNNETSFSLTACLPSMESKSGINTNLPKTSSYLKFGNNLELAKISEEQGPKGKEEANGTKEIKASILGIDSNTIMEFMRDRADIDHHGSISEDTLITQGGITPYISENQDKEQTDEELSYESVKKAITTARDFIDKAEKLGKDLKKISEIKDLFNDSF